MNRYDFTNLDPNQIIQLQINAQWRLNTAEKCYNHALRDFSSNLDKIMAGGKKAANYPHWRDAVKQASKDISAALEEGQLMSDYLDALDAARDVLKPVVQVHDSEALNLWQAVRHLFLPHLVGV